MKFTIESRFHPTKVTIVSEENKVLSNNQVKKIDKALCGMPECYCGGIGWSRIDGDYHLEHLNNSCGNTEYIIVKN